MTQTSISFELVESRLKQGQGRQGTAHQPSRYEGEYVDDLAQFMAETAPEARSSNTVYSTIVGVMAAGGIGIAAFASEELMAFVQAMLR